MKTLYLDLDGVIADFDRYAYQVAGLPPSGGVYNAEQWAQITGNPRLYRDLPKTTYADQLVKFCRDFGRQENFRLIFLTAVPKGNDMHWAFYDKVMWCLARYPEIPVHFGPYSADKYLHCQPGDVLIDDRESNIAAWNAAGGIGILHTGRLEKTIDQLINYKSTP